MPAALPRSMLAAQRDREMAVAIVSVMYPATPGSRFDMDYYLRKHMTMVAEVWSPVGLRGYQVLKGVRAPGGGEPVFQVVVNMDFESADAFEAAIARNGAQVLGDIVNFTDTEPTIQISDVADTHGG